MTDTASTLGEAAGVASRWGKVAAWWQWHPDIDIEILGLLSILATYADDDGYCDPSQKTIAKRAHRCRRSINALIARAEALHPRVLIKESRRRSNGGTTSCRYQIVREAPPEFAVWFAENRGNKRASTPRNEHAHTPEHEGAHGVGTDVHTKNQPQLTQNQNTRGEARAGSEKSAQQQERGPVGWETSDSRMPRSWQPCQEVIAEARRLFPAADVAEQTILFVSSCRSKGYSVTPDNADDTWLRWFIEDQRKARATASKPSGIPEFRPRASRSPERNSDVRMSAWANAAGVSEQKS